MFFSTQKVPPGARVTGYSEVVPDLVVEIATPNDSRVGPRQGANLEWSDLHHLGQLPTYATGLDARVAVWIAPEFRRQLAKALHRLNELTCDGIRFYAVKVEVVRSDGSTELEPRLHKVVWPGGWDEDSTVPGRRPVGGGPTLRRLLPAVDRRTRADGIRRRGPAALRPYRAILHPRDHGKYRLRRLRRVAPGAETTPGSRSTSARTKSNRPIASSTNSTPPARRSRGSSPACSATASRSASGRRRDPRSSSARPG